MSHQQPQGQIIRGRSASSGYGVGVVKLFLSKPRPSQNKGSVSDELDRFRSALATAKEQLKSLQNKADSLGSQFLQLQLELLDDPQLTDPVVERIKQGFPTVEAWSIVMDAQISDYRSVKDEVFWARATDFVDLKERVLSILMPSDNDIKACEPGAIYACEDMTPSRFLEIDWNCYAGAVLGQGSATGHVAMLARARNIPMLYGLGSNLLSLKQDAEAIIDAEAGVLIQHPSAQQKEQYTRARDELNAKEADAESYLYTLAVSTRGKRIKLLLSIDDFTLLTELDPAICDGIGLVRTEFMYSSLAELMDEERQYRDYLKLTQWAEERPVVIRTLDAGGDKPISGVLQPEGDSFLGQRGIRFSLARPDIFKVQLRALLRASALGDVRILLPMVTDPSEVAEVRRILKQQAQDLERIGFEARIPPLGMMVEVPAAALRIPAFQADFYSIGTSDLTQYVTAAGRLCPSVAHLQKPSNPAVMELVRRVVAYGEASGKEVILCGSMASSAEYVPLALDSGARALSVPPSAVAQTKAVVANYRGNYG